MNETWTLAPIIKYSRDNCPYRNYSMKKIEKGIYVYKYIFYFEYFSRKKIPSPETHVKYLNREGRNMRIFYYNFRNFL